MQGNIGPVGWPGPKGLIGAKGDMVIVNAISNIVENMCKTGDWWW